MPPIRTQNKVEVLGVSVSCCRRQDVLGLPRKWADEQVKRTIMYVNAHCLNLTTYDSEYQSILNTADLIYADGISVVWAAKFLGGCSSEKATGRDWIGEFCELVEQDGLRLFILAGKPGVAQKARKQLLKSFPKIQIVGVHNGYLEDKKVPDLITEINQSSPQILMIGMGTPLQEKWLAAYRNQIEVPVCWTVGALFDYVAGLEPPVPPFLNRIHLEWLWRMLVNPADKWRRYLLGNPVFIFRILRQKLIG